MPWRGFALYTTYTVTLYDRIAQDALTITRVGEDYSGYHALGRISYRGERLKLMGGAGGFVWAEDYPPPLGRCRTPAARAWWAVQAQQEQGQPNRIVFLDLDGVLNSAAWFDARGPRPLDCSHFDHNVDPAALDRLNRLCQTTGAQIVFTSTWRLGTPVDQLNADFRRLGCTAPIRDSTPDLSAQRAPRGAEIAAWLDAHRELDAFVILDDDADMGGLTSALVRTDHAVGLTEADVDRAIALLS